MRSTAAILFVLLYLVALCKPVAPLIEYYANRDFFVNVLCVNKDKPETLCYGSCALRERFEQTMREPADTEQTTPVQIHLEDYPVSLLAAIQLSAHTREATTIKAHTLYNKPYTTRTVHTAFRPPQVG